MGPGGSSAERASTAALGEAVGRESTLVLAAAIS